MTWSRTRERSCEECSRIPLARRSACCVGGERLISIPSKMRLFIAAPVACPPQAHVYHLADSSVGTKHVAPSGSPAYVARPARCPNTSTGAERCQHWLGHVILTCSDEGATSDAASNRALTPLLKAFHPRTEDHEQCAQAADHAPHLAWPSRAKTCQSMLLFYLALTPPNVLNEELL